MLLRRQLPLAAAALALACAPSVPYSAPPTAVNYAVFDITSSVPQIPLPNDLALQVTSIATFPPSAQRDLLAVFAAQGGFPNDQEVDITIDFQAQQIDATTGKLTNVAPDLDISTINPNTLKIIELPGSAVTYAPITAASYVKGTDRGTLTVKNLQGGLVGAPWAAGVHYAVAVRGGDNGVKTTGGEGIQSSPIFYLLTRGVNLSLPANETLLPGTRDQKAAAGAQLEQLRQSYLEPFTQVSSYFPSTDLAVMSTFQIAPNTSAYVQTDPNRGLIPLPSDFLLDATGHVQNIPAFGPLAAGLTTLDGFSTTGMVLSTVSAPILGATVNKNTVFLYDLSNPSAPVRVPDATEAGGGYQSEPPAITQSVNVGGTQVAVSTAIGLQPAIPLASGAMLPPLKENTEYAVLITNGVKDLAQAGLSRSTLAQLLLFTPDHPVAASGKSLLQGVPDQTAAVVESIRQKLAPAIAQLQTDKNIPRNNLSMAYTFKTQSITGTGMLTDATKPPGLIQFGALPYNTAKVNATTQFNQLITVDPIFTAHAPIDAFHKYGVDPTVVPGTGANDAVQEIIDAKVVVPEILSASTGAFDPALASNPTLQEVKVLISVPKYTNANVPACPAAYGLPAGTKCAPLVIFHHGLGGERANMLSVANSLNAQGFIVAAIDMAKHGERSWCSANNQCAQNANGTAGTCTPIPQSAGQGDSTPPGTCSNGPVKLPALCASATCLGNWGAWTAAHPTDPADGTTPISSQYYVSANFFRTRDTNRQDIIDQSALILALSRPPTALSGLPAVATANQALQNHLGGEGLVIDPLKIYWEGQSLGAIQGALNVAANPRISKAALNVGGGTLTDIFTNSPAFAPSTCALLQSVHVLPMGSCTPTTAEQQAAYLKFLIVAKWVLDPADPINAAGHILGDAKHPTLPNLLAGGAPQTGKAVLGQLAACDLTVPNPFNLLLYGNIGILDLAKLESHTASTGNVTLFADLQGSGNCVAGANAIAPYAVPHAFITTWGVTATGIGTASPSFSQDTTVAQLTGAAQAEAAKFLNDSTLPPSVVAAPFQ